METISLILSALTSLLLIGYIIYTIKLTKENDKLKEKLIPQYEMDKKVDKVIEKNKEQADTIKRLMINKDEVHVLLEKLIVSKKKERIELVNQYIFTK